MSLLGSIGKLASKVVGIAGGVASGASLGLPGMVIGGVLGAKGAGGGGGRSPPRLPSAMPGGGRNLPMLPPSKATALTIGASAAGAAAGDWLYDKFGQPIARRRRRRKGISAKDLVSFKRVARLVDKFSRPVHKMRNFKPSKGI